MRESMNKFVHYVFVLSFNVNVCMEIDITSEKLSVEQLFLSIEEPAEMQERFGHEKPPILHSRKEGYGVYKRSKIGIIDTESLKEDSSFCCFFDMCTEKRSTLEALAQHILCGHEKIRVGTKILCSIHGCLTMLSSHSIYKRHILRHLDIRNYECRECGKKFVTVSDRNSHERNVHHLDTYGSTRE